MTVSTFDQPNYAIQNGSAYKANIDGAIAVHHRLAGAFAPHQNEDNSPAVPDMTVSLDAGALYNGITLTEVAAQSTATITAPSVNPRYDIVYIDRTTGAVGVATGSEASSPADPAIPAGKLPIARILLTVAMTEITNADLTDIRVLHSTGLVDALAAGNGIAATNSNGTVTLKVDKAGLTDLSTGLTPAADYMLVWDADDSLWKIITATNFKANLANGFIASQATGDLLYMDATPALARLPKDTDGQVLTLVSGLPAWATAAGGLSLLQAVTASNSATVDLETILDSTYEAYLVTFSNVHPGTDATSLNVRLKVGGSYQTANYSYGLGVVISDSSGSVADGAASQGAITLNTVSSSTAERPLSGQLWLHSPANTAAYKALIGDLMLMSTSGSVRRAFSAGAYTGGTGAVTGLRFLFSSGNIASGEFKLYGLKKS